MTQRKVQNSCSGRTRSVMCVDDVEFYAIYDARTSNPVLLKTFTKYISSRNISDVAADLGFKSVTVYNHPIGGKKLDILSNSKFKCDVYLHEAKPRKKKVADKKESHIPNRTPRAPKKCCSCGCTVDEKQSDEPVVHSIILKLNVPIRSIIIFF